MAHGIDFEADPEIHFEEDGPHQKFGPAQPGVATDAVPETKGLVQSGLDVSPEETATLHALNPLGLGKTAMGVGEGLSEVAGAVPAAWNRHGLSLDAAKYLLSRYQKGHQTGQEAYDAATQKNPKSAIAGDVANAVGTGVVAGPLLSGVGKWDKAQRAARLGAIYGLGNSNADVTKGLPDTEKALMDATAGGATGGALANIPARTMLGAGAGALLSRGDIESGNYGRAAAKIGGGAALGQFAPKIPGLAKKAYGNIFGVSNEAIDDYLARSNEINASPTKTDMKDNLDKLTIGIRDRAAEAQDKLEKAHGQKVLETADAVEKGLGDLKDKLVSGSKDAMGVIQNATDENGVQNVGAIPVRELKRQLSKRINRLSPLGAEVGPPPGGASSSAARMQQWRDWLDKLPDNITYEQAKPVIQRLDRATQEFYGRMPGDFAPEEQTALARMRQMIDMKLKKGLPEYADAMVPVAEDAKLLSAAKDQLSGRPLLSKLQNLGSVQNNEAGNTMDRMGKRLGVDYRGMLNSPNEEAAATSAQGLADQMRPITPNAATRSQSENFLTRMTAGKENPIQPRVDDQRLADAVSKEMPEFPQQLQNLRTSAAFTGQRTTGARNSVRFGALGGAVGAAIGHPMAGASVGAAVGGVIDKFGPTMAKSGLDGFLAVKNKLNASGLSHYSNVLSDAAQKGADSYAARYYLMSQTSPEFRAALEGKPK